jgi:hypothetical protein
MLPTDLKVSLLTDNPIKKSIDSLLFILSGIAIVLSSPYFVWESQLLIFRITHLVGNIILLFIILKHNNYLIFNIELVLFFLLVSLYTMFAGTEIHEFSYLPLLSLLFISLRPIQQLRIFNYFVTILAVFYFIGLLSYLLSILGLNIQIGSATAPNMSKNPYLVFFGHVEESGLPIYRFSGIFDEPGVVGTLNGLILSSIGISTRNIKSIIILLAGLVSFSLAFYIILILFILFNLNFKNIFLAVFILITLILFSGDKFNDLIISRLAIEDGRLAGDNRTTLVFDEWYEEYLTKGGKDLILGRGKGSFKTIEEVQGVSTYKVFIINYGLIGVGLIICFYASCVYFINNSKKGWFLLFIFIISAYQRSYLLDFYSLIMFFGGLSQLKPYSIKR